MKNPRDLIIRPIITEETSDMMNDNKYVFEVAMKTNKIEVKQAIEQIFGVKVTKVNTLVVPGKPKNYGRYSGYRPSWKKAVVTLSADSKPLEYFETV